MYRVVFNETIKHPQWIVVHDIGDGRPVMVRGPFVEEHVAMLTCDALNRGSGPLTAIKRGMRLIQAHWLGLLWAPAVPRRVQ